MPHWKTENPDCNGAFDSTRGKQWIRMDINKLIISEAVENDLPCILELYEALESSGSITLSPAQAADVFREMARQPRHRLYVSRYDGFIVGTFVLTVLDYLAHNGKRASVLEDVVVHPDWRGKGVGRNLVEHAIGISRQYNCYKMSLSSNMSRQAAHCFYMNAGFRIHGYSLWIDPEQESV